MAEVRSALASVCSGEDPRAAIERTGVGFVERPLGDLVSVSAWPHSFELVCREMSAALDIKIPRDFRTAHGNSDHTLFMVAPQRFLICSNSQELGALLTARFDTKSGVITELGHSRTRIRIQGPNARALLARGVAIDLDADVFPAGNFAQSAIHHMWLLLHNVSSQRHGDAYDVYVMRSFAVSFWHWLTSSALLLGCETTGG